MTASSAAAVGSPGRAEAAADGTPAGTSGPAPQPRPRAELPPPCTAGYSRLAEVLPELRVHPGPPRSGNGWVSGADLLHDPAALSRLIAFDARQGLERYGRPLRPDVAAGFCLHRYCWPAGLLFTLPWFLEHRVPVLAPEAVSLRRRTGELTARLGAFTCLPGDPAAALPGALVVADEGALRAALLAALTAHLDPVLSVFRPAVRRGPRTLWAMATDAVVEGLWYVGGLLGEEERAVAALRDLLPDRGRGTAPFASGTGFDAGASGEDTCDGESLGARTRTRTRTRASCCLLYTARPETSCFGCPRAARG
ncbi:iron-sulfur protein [Kitasatospora sp. NPDC050543]|uniref:iron-sulfur protein n=1 Tax=Kitasatospora sp. NPDC050543 TaxID=3364054 RepID=UPI0037A4B413